MAPPTLEIGEDGTFTAWKGIVAGKRHYQMKSREFPEFAVNHAFEKGVKVKVRDSHKVTGSFPFSKEFDEVGKRR